MDRKVDGTRFSIWTERSGGGYGGANFQNLTCTFLLLEMAILAFVLLPHRLLRPWYTYANPAEINMTVTKWNKLIKLQLVFVLFRKSKELVQYFFVSSNFCCLSGKHVMQHRLLGVFNSLEIYLQNYDKSSSHRCTIRVGVGPDLSTGIVGH